MKDDSNKEDMTQVTNLDDATRYCPCGSCCDTGDFGFAAWMRTHLPHSSGYLRDSISDDGMRCLSADAQRTYRTKLVPR